jgi:signal transduction histidine kinase
MDKPNGISPWISKMMAQVLPLRCVRISLMPSSTKGHKDGSALGLYSAHMAVKDHGGWITCESIFDKGSCFTIFLPSFEAKPEEEDSAR